mgnify:CR=1 FL=1
MATILSVSDAYGRRDEYTVVGFSREDVQDGIRKIRLANPHCAVTFRSPFMERGRFKAIGWCEEYQAVMP